MASVASVSAPSETVDLILVDDDVPMWGGSWCQAGDWRWVLSSDVAYSRDKISPFPTKWVFHPMEGGEISFNTPRQACKEQWEFFHSLIVVGVAKKVQLPTPFAGI